MRQKSMPEKEPATQVVKNIRRATRRHFSAEDKIRIVLEGLRGEDSVAELCRRTAGPRSFSKRARSGWPGNLKPRCVARSLRRSASASRWCCCAIAT